MPPRKPLSSRASAVARRGGKGADPDAPQPFGGPTQVTRPPERRPGPDAEDLQPEEDPESYQTGSDYPAADEEDIYGEDDPYPDEEGGEVLAAPHTGELPYAPEVTRIAPIVDEDEEPEADDENATRAGPPIHVEVISGPDQGKTRRFRGVRMVIGRTQGCDFKLSDGSISRRHLELVVGDKGVLLRDLGSGNGTKVNGEKVNEKLLQDGDEVALGQTRFRFVDELEALRKKQEAEEAARKAEEEAAANEAAAGEADAPADSSEEAAESDDDADDGAQAKPARRRRSRSSARDGDATDTNLPALPSRRERLKARGARAALSALEPKQKRAIGIAAAAVVLLIVVAIGLANREPPPPPPNPNLEVAALKMQEARNAIREARFDEAIALIEQAEKLVPGSDPTGLEAGARKELAAQRGLEEVRALARDRQFDEARQKLATVQTAIVIGESEREKVRLEIDKAIVDDAIARANAALDAQDVATAEQLIQRLPRTEAHALTARLEEVKEAVARAEAERERQERAQAVASKRRAGERRSAQVDAAFAAVERKFHAGEFQRAVLECDRVVDKHRGDAGIRDRARDLKRRIPQFARYFEEGQKKYRANNLAGAARPLRKARDLYAQIGFSGSLGTIIDEQLASASLAAGKASMGRNDLASAVREFKDALALNPSETRAQQGIETAYQRAEELYLDAYMIRDRDPREAASKFRIVLDVLPSSSQTYQKAQAQLNNMGL